jgi:tight adherence protein B
MTELAILVLALAAAAAMLVAALRVTRRRDRDATVERRLATLRSPDAAAEGAKAWLGPDSGPRFLRLRFARAGVQIGGRAAGAATLAVLGAAGVLTWLNQPLLAVGLAALAVAGAVAALDIMARRNMAALARELPFLLDSVRQHLTVGASLQQAVVRAVDDAGPEIQRAFTPMTRRIENGASLVEALGWLADRIELPELDMLLVAIQTNTRFGGSMSPTLLNLSAILRDQARVTRELKAATSETRLSGWFLAGLPVAALVLITLTNREYASFLTGTPTGHRMLAVAAVWQALGTFFMCRIMRLSF